MIYFFFLTDLDLTAEFLLFIHLLLSTITQGVIVSIITKTEDINPNKISVSTKSILYLGTYLKMANTKHANVIYLEKFFKFIYN